VDDLLGQGDLKFLELPAYRKVTIAVVICTTSPYLLTGIRTLRRNLVKSFTDNQGEVESGLYPKTFDMREPQGKARKDNIRD
jgi:hypothetical protein